MRAVVKTSRTSYLKLIRGEAIKQESTRRHWTSVFTEAIRGDPSGNSRTINKTWWAKPRMFIVMPAALMLNLSCSDHGSRSGFLTSFVSLITLTRRQELDQSWGTPLLSRPDLHPYLAFFLVKLELFSLRMQAFCLYGSLIPFVWCFKAMRFLSISSCSKKSL